MSHPIKIATCCYCGARSLLKPTARQGHELACGACGAPLHEMKWLKSPEPAAPKRAPARPTRAVQPKFQSSPKPKKRKKPKKRRDPFFKDLLEDAWDFVEDIFD